MICGFIKAGVAGSVYVLSGDRMIGDFPGICGVTWN